MIARFSKSNKRVNSTKIPTFSFETELSLRAPTSIEMPYITIQRPISDGFTYCYIPELKRYYFVQSATAVTNDITGYQLAVDVLASFKDEILNATTWVQRSASQIAPFQYDGLWTHDGTRRTSTQDYDVLGTGISFVVEVVNGTGDSIGGGASFYSMNLGQFQTMVSQLFNPSNYSALTEEIKTYFNPFQYILSARMYPYNVATGSDQVPVGWWSGAQITGAKLGTQDGATIDFDFTPGGTAVDFTNRSPEWTRLQMYVPGIGDFELDPAYYGRPLTASLYIDYTTGQCNLVIRTKTTDGSGAVLLSKSGQMGIDIKLSQISVDQINRMQDEYNATTGATIATLQGLGQLVGGLATGNYGAAAGAVGGLIGIGQQQRVAEAQLKKDTCSPALSLSGTNANRYMISQLKKARVSCTYYTPLHKPVEDMGGVLNQRVRLGTLSGYTQVANGSIEVSATVNEKQQIKNLLEGGFFIEE